MTQKLDGGQFIVVAPLCSSVCLLVMLLVFVVACVSVSLRFVTGLNCVWLSMRVVVCSCSGEFWVGLGRRVQFCFVLFAWARFVW